MKKILTAFCIAAILFACDKNDYQTPEQQDEVANGYIYKERDPGSPLILSIEKDFPETRTTDLGGANSLGYGLKTDRYPFDRLENVSRSVIDMTKLNRDHSDWSTSKRLIETKIKSYSYGSFDRFEEKSEISKKVKSGFSLNLGIFKIGKQKQTTQLFSSAITGSSRAVYGELEVVIKDTAYDLTLTDSERNRVLLDYRNESFVHNIYNNTPANVVDVYGGFVLTNYITGGSTTAVYAGLHKTSTSATTKEQSMQKDVDASFSYKKVSGGVSLGVGNGYSTASQFSNEIEQMEFAVLTLGGRYGTQGAFTIPRQINNFGIDLTSWAASLNDRDTHTLMQVQDGGLLPLSSLVLEENLKKYLDLLVKGSSEQYKALQEPILYIIHCPTFNIKDKDQKLLRTYAVLWTRYGHGIAINQLTGTYESYQDDLNNLQSLADTYSQKYKIRTIIRELFPLDMSYMTFNESGFFENDMKRYVDTQRGMTYLLHSGKKIGYSIYTKEGDFLLDTYGIRQWVNSMPTTTVSDNELLTYTLVAL